MAKKKHGMSRTSLYQVWAAMKSRCDNPHDAQAHLYGGRGISYCVKWSEFKNFLFWARSSRYQEGLMLDRRENDFGYSPENCKWSTPQESGVNRRTTKLTWEKVNEIRRRADAGEVQKELAKEFGVANNTISSIVTGVKWKQP